MIARTVEYATITSKLVLHDLKLFQKELFGKFIDLAMLLISNIVVFGYFLPSYGVQADYGPFILVGAIAGYGFFEVIGKVGILLSDLETDRTILYTLSLPLPAGWVFSSIGISWAIRSLINALLLLPVGKLLLMAQFDLSKISFINLALMLMISNLFFGFFALWLTSVFKHMGDLGHLYCRIVIPLYMFGGYFYSWESVYQLSPWLGYVHLLNPLTYTMEGMRAAALGPAGYLSVGVSFTALVLFTLAVGWYAIRNLKKRLDVV